MTLLKSLLADGNGSAIRSRLVLLGCLMGIVSATAPVALGCQVRGIWEPSTRVGTGESVRSDESDTPSQPLLARTLRTFPAPAATQAVAVDEQFFYAIGNSVIVKHRKSDGREVDRWRATKQRPLRHLNSGLIHQGRLYCCHSNFPEFPETSSIEIFDPETLEHVGSHSFGIYEGSLTWVDWRDDSWWAVFAHYSKRVNDDPRSRPHTYTSLVKFDSQWRRQAGWVFPAGVLARFDPHSCSGGFWGPDNRLYVTGHDRGEVYGLELPKAGSELVWSCTIGMEITGQRIARDPVSQSSGDWVVYGIHRAERTVIQVMVPGRSPSASNPAATDPSADGSAAGDDAR